MNCKNCSKIADYPLILVIWMNFGGSDEFGETDGGGEYEYSGNFGHLVSIWWLWWVS